MFIRVIGSSAPKGSSMRMMRGLKIRVWAMATRCAHAAGELVRILVLVLGDAQPDLADPHPRQFVAELPGNALAFQPEGDVVQDVAVVEAGVVLEDHAAIGARVLDGPAEDEHEAGGGRMLGPQTGDQPQDRALAAAARAEDADELTLATRSWTTKWTSRMAVNSLG